MFFLVVSRERTADSFLCGAVRVAMRIHTYIRVYEWSFAEHGIIRIYSYS